MFGRSVEGLYGHNAGMNETGPDREPDQAAVLQRISRGNEQEDAESGIDAEYHLFVLGLIGLPAPTGRPPRHHEGIYGEKKNQANENQGYTQKAQLCRCVQRSPPPILIYWVTEPVRDASCCIGTGQHLVFPENQKRTDGSDMEDNPVYRGYLPLNGFARPNVTDTLVQ
jgi:hypothetical protein